MRFISRFLLSLVLLVTTTAVFAGETGSISGVVKDGTGNPVPGATVKVSGPQMPAGYTTRQPGQRVLFLPETASGLLHGRGRAEGTRQDREESEHLGRHGLPGRPRPRPDGGRRGDRHGRQRRGGQEVDRGQLELRGGRDPPAPDRPHLLGAHQPHSRRCRESRCGGRRLDRRSHPRGEQVPHRRRQHHEPRIRQHKHRHERARHRRREREDGPPSRPSSAAPRAPS